MQVFLSVPSKLNLLACGGMVRGNLPRVFSRSPSGPAVSVGSSLMGVRNLSSFDGTPTRFLATTCRQMYYPR